MGRSYRFDVTIAHWTAAVPDTSPPVNNPAQKSWSSFDKRRTNGFITMFPLNIAFMVSLTNHAQKTKLHSTVMRNPREYLGC